MKRRIILALVALTLILYGVVFSGQSAEAWDYPRNVYTPNYYAPGPPPGSWLTASLVKHKITYKDAEYQGYDNQVSDVHTICVQVQFYFDGTDGWVGNYDCEQTAGFALAIVNSQIPPSLQPHAFVTRVNFQVWNTHGGYWAYTVVPT